ncbi:hypothetical protein AAE478_009637 [Parahypoxylon ruwenzoriense]
MSSLLHGRQALNNALSRLRLDTTTLRAHCYPGSAKPVLLTATALAAAAPLLAYAYASYQAWLAIGRGGVPYNVLGWLAQASLHVVARRDTRDPVPRAFRSVDDVGALYGEAGRESYLSPPDKSIATTTTTHGDDGNKVDPRKGPRPAVPTFVVPQRQTSDVGAPTTQAQQRAFLAALAGANPALFELRPSGLEGAAHHALYLRRLAPGTGGNDSNSSTTEAEAEAEALRVRVGRGTAAEFAHVHGEGSAHVTLSPRDAAALIAGGWAERHALSGVGGTRFARMPWGYVMLYAPRDGAEMRVWREALLAAARYVAEGSGVEVIVPKEQEGERDEEEEEEEEEEGEGEDE